MPYVDVFCAQCLPIDVVHKFYQGINEVNIICMTCVMKTVDRGLRTST